MLNLHWIVFKFKRGRGGPKNFTNPYLIFSYLAPDSSFAEEGSSLSDFVKYGVVVKSTGSGFSLFGLARP